MFSSKGQLSVMSSTVSLSSSGSQGSPIPSASLSANPSSVDPSQSLSSPSQTSGISAKPSSMSVSQSLSTPSQTSVAPGLMAPSAGLQSVLSATYPSGATQASTESAASP